MFFQSIPDEMEEAAQMEGASDPYILLKIYVPLSKAMYATFTLFFAIAFWNSWFNALIYLKNQQLFPLQLAVRNLLSTDVSMVIKTALAGKLAEGKFRGFDTYAQSVQQIFKSAVMIVTILPLLIMYPFVQKYFVKGVMIGSIKG